jgi:hypothetical protein
MAILTSIQSAAESLLDATWQAGILAMLVLFVGRIAPGIPAKYRSAMWGVVLIRLLLPSVPDSSFSLFNIGNMRSEAFNEVVDSSPNIETRTDLASPRPVGSGHFGLTQPPASSAAQSIRSNALEDANAGTPPMSLSKFPFASWNPPTWAQFLWVV